MKDFEFWKNRKSQAIAARVIATEAENEADKELEKFYIKEFQNFVGKCYKYPNSDGTNEFPTYFKVQKIEYVHLYNADKPTVSVSGLCFTDHPERPRIETEQIYLHVYEPYPISKQEFEKAYKKVLGKLNA